MSLSSFLYIVKWFQVLLYNSHNSTSVTQFDLFDPYIGPNQVLPLSQSGPESDGNELVLRIPQISKAGASSSDGLMSYPGHSLGEGFTLL